MEKKILLQVVGSEGEQGGRKEKGGDARGGKEPVGTGRSPKRGGVGKDTSKGRNPLVGGRKFIFGAGQKNKAKT